MNLLGDYFVYWDFFCFELPFLVYIHTDRQPLQMSDTSYRAGLLNVSEDEYSDSLHGDMRYLTDKTRNLFEDISTLSKEIDEKRDKISYYEEMVSNNPSYADEVLEEIEGEDEENSFTITERYDYEHNQRNMRELTLKLHNAKLLFAQEKIFAIQERVNAGWYLKNPEVRIILQDLDKEVEQEKKILRANKTNWSDSGEGGAERRDFNSDVVKRVVEKQKRVVAQQSMTSNMQHIASVMEQLHKRVSRLEAVSVHKH